MDKIVLNNYGIDYDSAVERFMGNQKLYERLLKEFIIENEFTKAAEALEKKEYEKAMRARDEKTASVFNRKLERYQKNDLIDFLVRGNILPKYGFPIDSVELTQNIASNDFKSLFITNFSGNEISLSIPSALL